MLFAEVASQPETGKIEGPQAAATCMGAKPAEWHRLGWSYIPSGLLTTYLLPLGLLLTKREGGKTGKFLKDQENVH